MTAKRAPRTLQVSLPPGLRPADPEPELAPGLYAVQPTPTDAPLLCLRTDRHRWALYGGGQPLWAQGGRQPYNVTGPLPPAAHSRSADYVPVTKGAPRTPGAYVVYYTYPSREDDADRPMPALRIVLTWHAGGWCLPCTRAPHKWAGAPEQPTILGHVGPL